eukprot:4635251-Pyramimonas_sp.AAC.1
MFLPRVLGILHILFPRNGRPGRNMGTLERESGRKRIYTPDKPLGHVTCRPPCRTNNTTTFFEKKVHPATYSNDISYRPIVKLISGDMPLTPSLSDAQRFGHPNKWITGGCART